MPTRVDEATATARVAAGVAHLDTLDPAWRAKLTPDLLDMASGRFFPGPPDAMGVWPFSCGCVAAQWAYLHGGPPDTAGYYNTGIALLADRPSPLDAALTGGRWSVDHGFLAEGQHLGYDATAPIVADEYELLTRLWQAEIRQEVMA